METNVIFNRKNKLDKDGKGTIEIQVYISRGKRPCRSTGIKIEPKFWDAKKCTIKKSHPQADFINAQISASKNLIESYLLSQTIKNKKIDLNDLEVNQISFYTFFEKEVMEKSNIELSIRTKWVYARVLRYLKEYSTDITFDAFTVSFLEGFNKFLIEKKNLSVNSRASLFSKIKKASITAVRNDIISYSQNPFNRGFAVREIEVTKESLTLSELLLLEKLDMSLRPELQKTRDMFLFACYTGLRFGDLSTLTGANFERLPNGKLRLKYTPHKTRKINNKRVEWVISDFWNGKADMIINNYLNSDETLFFKYANQFYNRNLKELQRFAGITTKLTSHLARHTCITLLINDFGLSATNVQLIAGHSKIEMTLKYLRITEIDLSNAAKRIKW